MLKSKVIGDNAQTIGDCVYDISLDGSVVVANGNVVVSNTDG